LKVLFKDNIISPLTQIPARHRESGLLPECVCFNPFYVEVVEKPILSIKKKNSYKIIGNHMKLYLDCMNAITKYMKNNFIPIITTQTSGRGPNTPFTP